MRWCRNHLTPTARFSWWLMSLGHGPCKEKRRTIAPCVSFPWIHENSDNCMQMLKHAPFASKSFVSHVFRSWGTMEKLLRHGSELSWGTWFTSWGGLLWTYCRRSCWIADGWTWIDSSTTVMALSYPWWRSIGTADCSSRSSCIRNQSNEERRKEVFRLPISTSKYFVLRWSTSEYDVEGIVQNLGEKWVPGSMEDARVHHQYPVLILRKRTRFNSKRYFSQTSQIFP